MKRQMYIAVWKENFSKYCLKNPRKQRIACTKATTNVVIAESLNKFSDMILSKLSRLTLVSMAMTLI